MFTLGIIYGVRISDLIGLYVNLDHVAKHQMELRLETTRVVDFEVHDSSRKVTFPIRFDPGFRPEKTNLVSRMVEVWGEIPISVLQQFDLRKMRFGFVGLEDYMMYPLLRPGSFVQFDEAQRKVQKGMYRSEYERPIYFIELRDAYLCCWCELSKDRLIAIPHPLSPCRTREFAYPGDAEIIGRVTAVAARLGTDPVGESGSSEVPKRS